MAQIATFQISGNGFVGPTEPEPADFLVSKTGGVHEMVVTGGPILASLITPYLAIPGGEFVPVLENNRPLYVVIGARPFHAFLVGLQLKFFVADYDGNPVQVALWL